MIRLITEISFPVTLGAGAISFREVQVNFTEFIVLGLIDSLSINALRQHATLHSL